MKNGIKIIKAMGYVFIYTHKTWIYFDLDSYYWLTGMVVTGTDLKVMSKDIRNMK